MNAESDIPVQKPSSNDRPNTQFAPAEERALSGKRCIPASNPTSTVYIPALVGCTLAARSSDRACAILSIRIFCHISVVLSHHKVNAYTLYNVKALW